MLKSYILFDGNKNQLENRDLHESNLFTKDFGMYCLTGRDIIILWFKNMSSKN